MAADEIRDDLRPPTGPRPIVSVLPPREGFSADAVGAVGLMVHRLGAASEPVVGAPTAAPPFADRTHYAVGARFWPPWSRVARYHAGVVAALGRLQPRRIEVHNRADVAWRVRRAFPGPAMALFLHNDPQAMRGARTPACRRALLDAMQVICVSQHLRDRLMEGVAAGRPALVLPNALDLAALPAPVPPAERDKVFLFAGRIVADKGADTFVRAWAAVAPEAADWRAVMIGADRFAGGAPETPFMRALLPRARAAGIALPGYLPHAAVMQAMARAAVVVVPSRWAEPFGLVALEALANGAALIAAPRGALPEVAGEAALYADPNEPGALEAAMRRLIGDADLRAALGDAGRSRAQHFEIGAARARLAEIRNLPEQDAITAPAACI